MLPAKQRISPHLTMRCTLFFGEDKHKGQTYEHQCSLITGFSSIITADDIP